MMRMLHEQTDVALYNIVFPEEAVGPGGKWEVKFESRYEVQKTVYEIISIEDNLVTAKTTYTASLLDQKARGPSGKGQAG